MPKTTSSGEVSARSTRSTRNRPTDDELLDAALSVIADVGAQRATMDMIAERGGTSRVTLYAHFGSRDSLVEAVIDRELTALTEWMFAAYDKGDDMTYGDRARYSVEALFEFARRQPRGFRVLLTNRDEDHDPGRRLFAALEPRIAERLRGNYAEQGDTVGASADTLASMLLGMSLDVAYRAVIVSGAGIDAACDLAVTASLAVLRSVEVRQLHAIDESLES
ncbi:TetR/AcrR family transcriptional regulator [Gordonia rubripertincta]|uniref:TetR/AcrR family transcriptional regulator n=1 Tax=Gordonia rubripertincta TaxID=36822 RepID=A0ABT4MSI4_GORRU|nr:TetR/AcrR family transcriptional regulator [Gordonia rubripertincta]MCZ4549966.1 TetR/AcrR family transcriptional regulator [Gordonia rubripertincta]